MYNEVLFFLHIAVICGLLIIALRHSYAALLTVLGGQLILANLFVTKQITLFGCATTTAEVFIVSGMFGISLIQEYYGTRLARRTIWYCFGMLLFFLVMSQFHLAYLSCAGEFTQAFEQILAYTPRIACASLVSYLLSERVNIGAQIVCRRLLPHRVAQITAIAVGQIVDTCAFASIGLYGAIGHLEQVIFFALLVKGIVIMTMVPVIAYIVYWMPHTAVTEES